jgi:hypothetical protein
MDLLATNHLGRAMHAALYESVPEGVVPNFVRFTFLHLDAARDFYPNWETAADTSVAILHTEAGRDPHDKQLHDLVGELSTRSDDFRHRWGAHDVRYHGAGSKTFHHRDVGDLELAYESMDMLSDPWTHPHPLRRRTSLTQRPRTRPARVLDQPHPHVVTSHHPVTPTQDRPATLTPTPQVY